MTGLTAASALVVKQQSTTVRRIYQTRGIRSNITTSHLISVIT